MAQQAWARRSPRKQVDSGWWSKNRARRLILFPVAENSKAPLYVLSAGDFGSTPEKLEPALESALAYCQLWGAMLLLNEADVFLQSRGSESMKCNELVSSQSAYCSFDLNDVYVMIYRLLTRRSLPPAAGVLPRATVSDD